MESLTEVLYREVGDRTMLRPTRLETFTRLAAHVPDGCIAEVGVRDGGTARFLGRLYASRTVYAFDTYTGMPHGHEAGFGYGMYAARPDTVAWLQELANVVPVVGTFPASATAACAAARYALVHLDADLYQTTRDALEFFWPRLDGYLVIDDFGRPECPGVAQALLEYLPSWRAHVEQHRTGFYQLVLRRRPVYRELTLNVCQGIGDIFWVYQLAAPHADRLNLNIMRIGQDADIVRAGRAVEFIKRLPKVKRVTTTITSRADYVRVAHGRFELASVLEHGGDYACNARLEHGERLDDLAVDRAFYETVALAMPQSVRWADRYFVLYVSGSTMIADAVRDTKLWSIDRWIEFMRAVITRFNITIPVVILGAQYDRPAVVRMRQALQDLLPVRLLLDAPAPVVCQVLRDAELFIGYQSGLNVLADQLDVNQLMLYFPHLEPMLYAWPKRQNITSGRFRAATFASKPRDLLRTVETMPWKTQST